MESADKIILGAGIFGLYAALLSVRKGEKVIILEYDKEAFGRASFINQARIHNGYHYPRSYTTAVKSAEYFQRFSEEFNFCINKEYTQVYAISNMFSWVNAQQFVEFCGATGLYVREVNTNKFLKDHYCDGVFEAQEYSLDVNILKAHLLKKLSTHKNCTIHYNSRIERIYQKDGCFIIDLLNRPKMISKFMINATYASINQIHRLLNYRPFKVNFELCEIIICKVSQNIRNIGITLIDGPFFSLMPFGKTEYHTLSAVQYTPHKSIEGVLPRFDCQTRHVLCNANQLDNCNSCVNKPRSNWPAMYRLAKKYLRDDIEIQYVRSLFTVKAVLVTSDVDDSRPTIIKRYSKNPDFYSVFSGKITSIYELDKIMN